jgi:hypothetical protein
VGTEEQADLPASSEAPLLRDDMDVELAFWDTIKDSDSPAEFDIYLKRFPQGAFVELARTRRDALQTPKL